MRILKAAESFLMGERDKKAVVFTMEITARHGAILERTPKKRNKAAVSEESSTTQIF